MYNDLFSVGPFTVHGYGLMIGIGFALAVIFASLRAKRWGLNGDFVYSLAILALIAGFAGGKLLYVLVEWKAFVKSPLSVLGSSGFVVYGGLLFGILAAFLFCRIKKQSFLIWFDLLIPFVALAQGFGRIGCFLAGCCYGQVCESGFSVVFPAGSIAPSGVPLIPTQLISAAGDFLLCAGLLLLGRRLRRGLGGCVYLILYGVGRFLVELLRGDPRGEIGLLSTSQFLSILMVAAGIILFVCISLAAKRSKPAEPDTEKPGDDA